MKIFKATLSLVVTVVTFSTLFTQAVFAHHMNGQWYWSASFSGTNGRYAKATGCQGSDTPPCDEVVPNGTGGNDQLIGAGYYSPSMGHKVGYMVYLPPDYNPNRENGYPVIYYLHGINGNELSYFNGSAGFTTKSALYGTPNLISEIYNAHSGSTPKDTIVVFANIGSGSAGLDFTGFLDENGEDHHGASIPVPTNRWNVAGHIGEDPFLYDKGWDSGIYDFRILTKTSFINELIPHIDSTYNTLDSRSGRALQGFSMGGSVAIRYALEHPEMFCSTVGYEPAAIYNLSELYYPEYVSGSTRDLGNRSAQYFLDNNMSNILSYGLRVRMAYGASGLGFTQIDGTNLYNSLLAAGVPAGYLDNNDDYAGVGHNQKLMANSGDAESLAFHWSCFEAASGGTNAAPNANMTTSATSGYAPHTVDFDGTTSTDSDGTIVSYEWDFTNDGVYDAAGVTASYTYSDAGDFTAKLRVTDNEGAINSETVSITVNQLPTNIPPVGEIAADPISGFDPLLVNFDGSGSTDSDGTIVSYEWDFTDDGVYDESGVTANHVYTVFGNYTAKLRVTDDDGATSIDTVTILVDSTFNYAPSAVLSANPTAGSSPLTVNFNGAASADPDGTIALYEWDFEDDGITDATGVTASYTYTTVGSYTAKLTVTDNEGAQHSSTTTVTVNEMPPAPEDYAAYWQLNETSGPAATTYPTSSVYNGAWNGSPVSISGKYGNAVKFDPTNGADYLDIGTGLPASSVYTVSAWVRFDTSTANSVIMGFVNGNNIYTLIYFNQSNNDCLGFNTWNTDCYGISNAQTLVDGQFHHVVAEFNSNAFTSSASTPNKLWIDGQNVSGSMSLQTPNKPPKLNIPLGNDLGLGNRGGTNTMWSMNGALDDVKVYTRVLSDTEVNGLYSL